MSSLSNVEVPDRISSLSQYGKINTLVVHSVGSEAILGLSMPPKKSLFEETSPGTLNVQTARNEHDNMVDVFENRGGINVINMRVVIGIALAEKTDFRISRTQLLTEMRLRLQGLRKRYKKYAIQPIENLYSQFEVLLDADIQSMGLEPALAINAVLSGIMDVDGKLQKFNPETFFPICNVLYARDPIHVTVGDFVGLNKMKFPIRNNEVALMAMGLEALGIPFQYLFSPEEKGSLEGGDPMEVYFDGEHYAIIGQADRTDEAGVKKWFEMHEEQFERDGVIPMVVRILVKPEKGTQPEMHLDTQTAFLANDVVIHCGEITDNRVISRLDRVEGVITEVETMAYRDWLESHTPKEKLYEMSRQEQLQNGANVLVEDETVYVSRNHNEKLNNFLVEQGMDVVHLNMVHVPEMYGATHCATNVLDRDDV